jgi:pimeloyl-ACP methyl ester carboxylesterase
MRPTIVLVHGAFAESASWDDVVDPLLDAGYSVVAAANPLRSVRTDAAAVSDVVRTIDGPVVLVGHSYGGMVISERRPRRRRHHRARLRRRLRAGGGRQRLLAGRHVPGQHSGRRCAANPTRRRHYRPLDRPGPLPRPVLRRRAGGPGPADGRHAAARHIGGTAGALREPLWKQIPSWFVFGEEDRNIPAALEHHMAERARAHRTIEIPGASHAVSVAHPAATARLILEAAAVQVGV